MSGGQPVAPTPTIPVRSSGLRIEVGAPVWAEIAKRPAETFGPTDADLDEIDLDKPREDPRDVPLWKPVAVLGWCLENLAYRDHHRRVLSALYAAQGDVDSVARSLHLGEEFVRATLTRSKVEVRHAARLADYEENFTRDRAKPGRWPHRMHSRIAGEQVWFPRACDLLCFLFDMDRRVDPYGSN